MRYETNNVVEVNRYLGSKLDSGEIIDYESVLEMMYRRFLKDNDVVIDIGTHEGRHLGVFDQLISGMRIHAFEPLPSKLTELYERFGDRDNIVIHDVALTNYQGESTFKFATIVPSESGLKQREYNVKDAGVVDISVKTDMLDNYIDEFSKVDYIKIDIEGGEIDCLNGGRSLIQRFRPIISVGYGRPSYSGYGNNVMTLYDWASSMGYFICDIFGNRVNSAEEWRQICDTIYWDYFLVPEEAQRSLPACTVDQALRICGRALQDHAELEVIRAEEAWDFLADEKKAALRLRSLPNSLGSMHTYFNELVSGNPDKHYLLHFKDTHLAPGPINIASLGCGGGHLENTLIDFGFEYARIDGYEISPHLVEACNAKARNDENDRLKYHVHDLNHPSLPKNTYQLVIFFHSLHHVDNLEACLEAVKRSLTNDGLLLVVDFTGPNRHQWTDIQVMFAQAMLETLPKRYRRSLAGRKDIIYRPTVEEVIAGDPSEAPRSEDILEKLHDTFRMIDEKPLGGTLLQLLFDGIAQNFDEDAPEDLAMIRKYQELEKFMIEKEIIPSDYLYAVYSK